MKTIIQTICFIFCVTSTLLVQAADKKVLVVVLSETRAHELTYDNFEANVLKPLNADLAICIGVTENYPYENPFYKAAKYHFLYPETDDFGPAFDQAYQEILETNPSIRDPLHWREFLKIKDQFMGGVKDRYEEHPASAGILIFFRWFLLKNLVENDLLEKYDFFVITRSDYLYVLPHPTVSVFSEDLLYIPEGEFYNGVTDRHVVLPKKFVVSYLNLLERMIDKKYNYFNLMKPYRHWNLESLIRFHLVQNGIWESVRFFPYVMYAVRPINGTTRWSRGVFSKEDGYYIKYPSEYKTAHYHKTIFDTSGEDLTQFYQNRITSRQP